MASLKQIQEELKSQTQIHCGINKITTNKECIDWGENNTHFYSQNGSVKRLDQCESYFKIFKTNAEKPVSKLIFTDGFGLYQGSYLCLHLRVKSALAKWPWMEFLWGEFSHMKMI